MESGALVVLVVSDPDAFRDTPEARPEEPTFRIEPTSRFLRETQVDGQRSFSAQAGVTEPRAFATRLV
jgi:hypothetical protein